MTPAANVGELVESRPGAGEGLTDLVFASTQPGYRGWSWVVTLAAVADAVSGEAAPPTVLELSLLPGEGALLAPEWIPWSVRLAEWEAQQKAAAAAAEDGEAAEGEPAEDLEDADDEDDFDESEDDDDEDDDELEDADDEEDLDDDIDDDELVAPTHGGDIDGVDIDDLDEE